MVVTNKDGAPIATKWRKRQGQLVRLNLRVSKELVTKLVAEADRREVSLCRVAREWLERVEKGTRK